MRSHLFAIALGLLSFCVWSSPAEALQVVPGPPAQPAALRGDGFRIASVLTGRTYDIHVRYPEGYDPAAATLYPTVYLTDGDSLFPLLATNQLFLHYDDGLPEALVVGIAYGGFDPSVNRREVDYTPAVGAEAFQAFLKTELLPEVERRYRSDPARRVLFGQSRGGGFVIWSALTDPDLFWGRIASNPAFGPDETWAMAETSAVSRSDAGLFVASGSNDRPALRQSALRWRAAWQGRQTPWRLRFQTIEGGTHAANATDVYRQAMHWLFAAP